jgi:type VI secretion system protein ImpK
MNTTHIDTTHFHSLWREIVEPTLPTAEEAPSHFLVPKTATYYRSKAFVSQISINPLIAASAPLFFLIETIQSLPTAPDLDKLHQDLMHEIHAFEHQASAHGYRTYMILAARYVLCAWIDQTIFSTPWGGNSHWESIQLADTPETDKKSPFFLLLHRCLQEPTLYIDLLELFYLCLSLGCTGNTENSAVPELQLQQTHLIQARDYLFEAINTQRKGRSHLLEIDTPVQAPPSHFSLRAFLRPLIILSATLILIATYFILRTQLEDAMYGIFNAPL